MPLFDFQCPECQHEVEEIVLASDVPVPCPKCQTQMKRIWKRGPPTMTTIIPSYPGCKAQKAGYVHTHGPQPATKVQSGYGGCQSPRS